MTGAGIAQANAECAAEQLTLEGSSQIYSSEAAVFALMSECGIEPAELEALLG